MTHVVLPVLVASAIVLSLGSLLVAWKFALVSKSTLAWTTPLGALVAAAAIARLSHDGGSPATLAALGILLLGQALALALPRRILWAAALILPAAGILIGAVRSNVITQALSIPLAVLVAMAAPITIRALAEAKNDEHRRGAFLLLTIALAVGAAYSAIFLALRARGG